MALPRIRQQGRRLPASFRYARRRDALEVLFHATITFLLAQVNIPGNHARLLLTTLLR